MDLTAIRTLIRNQTEAEVDDITDDDIDEWVNNRYNLVNTHRDWPYLETSTTIAVSAGATTFALPADFANFRDVRYNPTGSTQNVLEEVNPEEGSDPNSSQAQGRPSAYWRVGASASANLDRPVDAGTIALIYYNRPDELTALDSPIFDSQFHRILVYGGLVEVYEKTFDFDEAAVQEQKYERMLGAMVDYYNRLRTTHFYGASRQRRTPRGRNFFFDWE